jgi:hypothetical protein
MQSLPTVPIRRYEDIRSQIKSGDILLCSGNSVFSGMIQKTTQSMWSHVAFILRVDAIDRIIILESVESVGVRAVTLGHYVKNYNGSGKGYPGQIMLARHEDVQANQIIHLSRFATGLLGYPYSTEEILKIATRISLHNLGLNLNSPESLPSKAFICSEYAYLCFKSIGIEIDFDALGFISPADFARSTKIKPIAFIEVENSDEHYLKTTEGILFT